MTTMMMGTAPRHNYERRPLLLLVILSTFLLASVSQGAPAAGSGSLEDPSGGDSEDLPEYRLHPRPPLYRYFISNNKASPRSSSTRDHLNSVYASPSKDIVLDSPVAPEEDKNQKYIPPALAYPPTPPPFAPELTKDTLRTQESGGLGPFSLLDQLQPSLW